MGLRRTVAVLLVLPAFAACSGADDGGGGSDRDQPEASDTSTAAGEGGDVPSACSLLERAAVEEAVGTAVEEGVGADGPVVTGGTQSTCTWRGVENPSASATVTIYAEPSAADSVRTDDSAPLPEVGDDAFVGPIASVWAYAGGGSFMAQWYDFNGSDEDNLPKSTALALLVRDVLVLSGPDGRMVQ